MADDEKIELSPAALRKMLEQAGDKAINRLATRLGYDDADDLVEHLGRPDKRGGRDRDRDRDRRDRDDDRDRETEAQRREREAAEAKKRADDEAAKKAADDAAKAEREAAIKQAREEAEAKVREVEARAALRETLLDKGVKRADLEYVLYRHKTAIDGLPEAERAKGVDVEQFLLAVSKDAPQVFAEGRAPKPSEGGGAGGQGDGGQGGQGSGGTGTGTPPPPARTSVGGEPKDFSKASPMEISKRLDQLRTTTSGA